MARAYDSHKHRPQKRKRSLSELGNTIIVGAAGGALLGSLAGPVGTTIGAISGATVLGILETRQGWADGAYYEG